LRSIGSSAFDVNSSIAMCRTANAVKQAINDAALGDILLCFVQTMASSGLFGLSDAQFYDGVFHTFALTSAAGLIDHFRVKVLRNTLGQITDFTMQTCANGTLTGFLSQTIQSNTMTMHSEGSVAAENIAGTYQIDVRGELNTNRLYTSKTVLTGSVLNFFGNTYRGEQVFVQGANTYTLSGYEAGAYTFNGFSGNFENQLYASGQLIDGNVSPSASTYDIGLLALGDGAATTILSNTFDTEQFTFNDVQSWNGDTTAIVASNEHTSAAQSGTPPNISIPNIQFTGDEVYDCSAIPEATLTLDVTAIENACAHLTLGHQWIDCWNIIENAP